MLTRRIVTAAALGLAVPILATAGALLLQPRWLVALLAGPSPEVVYFVDTREPLVALTLDDGPDAVTTPEILRVLAQHEARATHFLISGRIPGNEGVVAQIVAHGHELGNHLTKDEPSIGLPPREFEAALLEAHGVLSRFAPVRWFRPGAGWYNDTMLAIAKRRGYRCALGSAYPYDAALPWARFAAWHVLRNARAGSVVVLHDGGARGRRTATALRIILPELRRRGLRVVTLSELVAAGS